MFMRNGIEGSFAVVDRLNAEAFALEIHTRQLYDGWFIVYKEDEVVHVRLLAIGNLE
jgi:N6-adenosine-specific RNA methylase IME4